MNSYDQTPTKASTFLISGIASKRSTLASGVSPFVAGSILLGTIGIFVHEAHAHPLTATWFRCAFGLFGLTLWIVLRRQLKNLRLPRQSQALVLSAGLLMVFGWGLFFAAIERTSAGVATVLFHIQPLWVLILTVLWLKESVARKRIASVMIAMAGLIMATGVLDQLALSADSENETLHADYWVGVALCIMGAFCTACVTIIAKRLQDMPVGIIAWWQCAVGTLVLLAWPVIDGWPAWSMSWAWLSGLGLIHTGLAYSLMYAGMSRMNTDRIAVLQFSYPAIAIIIDWVLYDHRLGYIQMLGITIMAAAIWSAEHVARRPKNG